jgi:hypothetical protein
VHARHTVRLRDSIGMIVDVSIDVALDVALDEAIAIAIVVAINVDVAISSDINIGACMHTRGRIFAMHVRMRP